MPSPARRSSVHFVSQSDPAPRHTAIIMDGNGRWAASRGLPRLAGHREGARALRRSVEAAPVLGIQILTLYAFSSDNWKRPSAEVRGLMELLATHLRSESKRCAEEGVRISMIGRRDRLPASVVRAAEDAESRTRQGAQLHLRLAIDYSARDSILSAARGALAEAGEPTREALARAIGDDVDLLIRTGGEQRLSDFLLWESAYAELVFTPRMWPDFGAADLRAAVTAFQSRERRFGRVPSATAPDGTALGQLCAENGSGIVSQFRGDRWLR